MSEENEVVIEQQSEPEVIVEEQDTPPDQQEQPEKKQEWVEFSPEQQRKFNDLYKQTKMSDQRNQMLTGMLEDAVKQIDELRSRFQQTDQAEAERVIMSRIQDARDAGDTATELKLIGELTDFKAEQKLAAKQPQAKPQVKPEAKSIDDVVTSLPPEDIQSLQDLVFEKSESGELLRPYYQDDHPENWKASQIAFQVSQNVQRELGYLDVQEVIKRVDQEMNKTKKPPVNPRAPHPMGGNLTRQPARGTLKLSAQEAAIAAKLGVSPKAYAESRESLKKGR